MLFGNIIIRGVFMPRSVYMARQVITPTKTSLTHITLEFSLWVVTSLVAPERILTSKLFSTGWAGEPFGVFLMLNLDMFV